MTLDDIRATWQNRANGPTVGEQNGGVHPDHVAIRVEQRAAGATINGIGLDVVVICAPPPRTGFAQEIIPADTETCPPNGLHRVTNRQPAPTPLSPKLTKLNGVSYSTFSGAVSVFRISPNKDAGSSSNG
jgi:hypothetical protein